MFARDTFTTEECSRFAKDSYSDGRSLQCDADKRLIQQIVRDITIKYLRDDNTTESQKDVARDCIKRIQSAFDIL